MGLYNHACAYIRGYACRCVDVCVNTHTCGSVADLIVSPNMQGAQGGVRIALANNLKILCAMS